MRQGKTASFALSGMLVESGTGFCFVSGRNMSAPDKFLTFLQNIPLTGYPYPANPLRHLLCKCHLPRGGRLIPHPHLAGTQTALPSVPVPTKVSFVAAPASHLRCQTFPKQENNSRLCQTATHNIPLSEYPYSFCQTAEPPVR